MNIVKGLIRTLKSSTESNLRTEIGPSHPRGIQRPVYELGEKDLFLPLAPARRGDFGARFDNGIYLGCRSFDGQACIGTPRCRTVRQLSAQERWDTEFVLSIKGTPWSPDGERAGDVNIRVALPEAGGDRGAHPPDVEPSIIPRRMRLTKGDVREVWSHRPMFGLPCHSNRVGESMTFEQRPDREVIEGTGASSSRDGAGNEQEATGGPLVLSEPQPRPAESSVSVDQPPREQR